MIVSFIIHYLDSQERSNFTVKPRTSMAGTRIFTNLRVMLTGSSAAEKLAAYQRAHAMAPDDAGIMSNLGNALRVRKGGWTRPNHCTIVP
jgi:hypothetical protein